MTGSPWRAVPGVKHMRDCTTLENVKFRRFGEDMLITGYPVYLRGVR